MASRTANIRTPVYLDNQATTPLDPRVLEKMLPWFTEKFGNPNSTSHGFGREADEAVEHARGQVAAAIGAEAREIVFTSGATESNNLAIKGAALFEKRHRDRRKRVVTLATEHKCVLESVRALEDEGFETVFLPVGRDGLVDMDRLAGAIDDNTLLVSVMAANNEIGVLQPIAEIGALARERGALFHSDAAQAVGKVPLDVEAATIDLMSLSGHKIYGPKGIGVLYVRRRPRARIEPLFSGGGQERTLRSGTLAPPLVVGIGQACALAAAEREEEAVRLAGLRDRLWHGLEERVGGISLNGDAERRLPGNLNIAIEGIDALKLIEHLPDLALSTGSACTSASVETSYVLRGIGLDDKQAAASVRAAVGRFNTPGEIDFAIDHLAEAVAQVRGAPKAS
ncbi:MAG: aminotransferase class V-fold PLP-dependent enzyme [Proteobacteria bacterium]|nr:aminotransferase class V-fold PLP-dependent enzyme [Pseudomonadota bacterium]